MKEFEKLLSKYNLYKSQLLKFYDNLNKCKTELQNTLLTDLPQVISMYFESLSKKIENLNRSEIIIAVAGEVKAGKSTFINALIGEEILPTDVLQATSAIIELLYSPKPFLSVTYASGEIVEYKEESIAVFKDILRKIASIPDEYRDIPTILIDQYLLDFKEKPVINDEFIKYLEEKSGYDNLFDKKEKIIKYTNELSLSKIPVKIKLGYPLPIQFEELRIIDMPGVNAVGGVQDITFSFLERANAILFIHPIKPVESESFKRFVDSIITTKSKRNLFLILTHSAVFQEEKQRLVEEAKRLYNSIISSDRIFAVDSILKLIYEDLIKGKPPMEIKSQTHKRKWFILYNELAEEENTDIRQMLLHHSGFDQLMKQLESFIAQVPIESIKDIIQTYIEIYENLIDHLDENIKILTEKKKDPDKFLQEITHRQKGLENFESKAYIILEEAYINFFGTNAPIELELNDFKLIYYEKLSNAKDIEELRKVYRDAENELNSIIYENQKKLNNFFRNKINELGENLSEEYNLKIPKIDLLKIEETCKQKATRVETIYKEEVESLAENWNFLKPWKWFKSARVHLVAVGNRVIFDEVAFFNDLKNTLIKDLTATVETLRDEYYRAMNFYKTKISEIINDKKSWLEQLRKELKDIEKIEQQILFLQKEIVILESELKKIKALGEDLK